MPDIRYYKDSRCTQNTHWQKNTQNTEKCAEYAKKYATPIWSTQNRDMFVFCVFCVRTHSPLSSAKWGVHIRHIEIMIAYCAYCAYCLGISSNVFALNCILDILFDILNILFEILFDMFCILDLVTYCYILCILFCILCILFYIFFNIFCILNQ